MAYNYDDPDWVPSPLGPAQYTQNDNGPPWTDDGEYFPGKHYYEGSPATPILRDGQCSSPLHEACETRGVLTAHLDGPVNCGGNGWFCRLTEQPGFINPDGLETDLNFAHCNATDADYRDNDGHCHGSNDDSTYGWWVRDHWFRGYASKMECCCDWGAVRGLTNRCDMRRFVPEEMAGECRDANEDHPDVYPNGNFEDGCATHEDIPFYDPLYDDSADQCWTVEYFADPLSVDPPFEPPSPDPPSPGDPDPITSSDGVRVGLIAGVTVGAVVALVGLSYIGIKVRREKTKDSKQQLARDVNLLEAQ